MKAVVAAFNQEKALVGAFSVIVQIHRLIDLRHYLEVCRVGGGAVRDLQALQRLADAVTGAVPDAHVDRLQLKKMTKIIIKAGTETKVVDL